MSRRRSRVSRNLVGVMVLTVGVGAGFYYARHRSSKLVQSPPKVDQTLTELVKSPAIPTTNPVILVAEMGPVVTEEPTTRATTGPAATTEPVVGVLPAGASAALAEGKGKVDAGDLIEGRRILNDAILSGGLSAEEEKVAKQVIAGASKVIVFGQRRFGSDPFEGTHTVTPGEVLQKIAYGEGVTWEYLLHVNGMTDPKRLRAGATLKTVHGPFCAVVSKGAFTMDLWLGTPGKPGGMYVTTVSVGLGSNDSTPTGTWVAGGKLKNPAYFSPRGEGVIAADDPKNPLGEYWISLQGVDGQAVGKMSYGVHGTIDPESIGKQSSMGCIRLRAEDIALVYELLVEGKSLVVVKD